jgi:hypothetical protein
MTFIGHFPCFALVAKRERPPHDELDGAIWAAEFDGFAAKLRHRWIIPRLCRGAPKGKKAAITSSF